MSVYEVISKAITSQSSRIRGSSVKAKSTRAAMALAAGAVVERSLRFVRYVILARILAPDQFGLMALVMVASSAFEALTEVGVKQSVIQNKRGADPEYLNVAWWFQAIRGLGLFLIGYAASPWISEFYDKPELLWLLRVAFLAVLFRGLASPRTHVLEKEYRFGTVVLLVQGSGALGAVIAIVLAFILRSVWALVIGFVSEFAITCVLSYVLVPFLPKLRMERECLRELMDFARGMLGVAVLAMVAFEIDVLVLGKVVSGEELGMYYLATNIVLLPITLFGRVIAPVLLPAFSEKQDDRETMRRVLLWVTRNASILILPLVAFMASCAGGVLVVVYGSEYAAVTAPFVVLCVVIVFRTQSPILNTVYLAIGEPRLNRRFVALRAAIVVGLIYPAVVYFGLLGAAVVVVLGNGIALVMNVVWLRRIIGLDFRAYARCYLLGLMLALPILAINVLRIFGMKSPVTILLCGCTASILSFAVGGYIVMGEVRGKRDNVSRSQTVRA